MDILGKGGVKAARSKTKKRIQVILFGVKDKAHHHPRFWKAHNVWNSSHVSNVFVAHLQHYKRKK